MSAGCPGISGQTLAEQEVTGSGKTKWGYLSLEIPCETQSPFNLCIYSFCFIFLLLRITNKLSTSPMAQWLNGIPLKKCDIESGS